MSGVFADVRKSVPADWTVLKLSDVAIVASGTTPARSEQSRYYDGGCTPWVKTGDLNNGFVATTDESLTPAAISECSVKIFPPDTVLVAMYGGFRQIGRTGRLAVSSAVNQALSTLQIEDQEVLPAFVQDWLNTRIGLWRRFAASSRKDPNITGTDVAAFPVAFPKATEQQRIANLSSTWDQAIELTEKLIAAKQKRKQALMQQLLTGEARLNRPAKKTAKRPPIVRVPAAIRRGIYPPSVQPGIPKLQPQPKGWSTKSMAELLETKKRKVKLDNDSVYDLVVAKRNRGGIEPRGKLRGSEIRTKTQFNVEAGDFVISRRQIVHGACGIVPPSLSGAIVSNEYSVFTFSDQLDPTYLRFLSHSLYFQQTCFHSSVGVAVEKMIFKVEQWLKYPFHLPPVEEQKEIAHILKTAETEISLLKTRVEKLQQQKKGLMQQLLTGKIRVKLSKAKGKK